MINVGDRSTTWKKRPFVVDWRALGTWITTLSRTIPRRSRRWSAPSGARRRVSG